MKTLYNNKLVRTSSCETKFLQMHAAFDQNKSIYFENQARYGIIVKEVYISF
jgi:hypothetical protein